MMQISQIHHCFMCAVEIPMLMRCDVTAFYGAEREPEWWMNQHKGLNHYQKNWGAQKCVLMIMTKVFIIFI